MELYYKLFTVTVASKLPSPPHDLNAEESVLGSVLIDPKCLLHIADSLRPEDFFAGGNGTMYSAMLELFHDHKPIDLITVSNLLSEKGVFDTVGGAARLAELSAAVPSASHVEEYADIVRKKATLRGLLAASDRIAGSVQEEGAHGGGPAGSRGAGGIFPQQGRR